MKSLNQVENQMHNLSLMLGLTLLNSPLAIAQDGSPPVENQDRGTKWDPPSVLTDTVNVLGVSLAKTTSEGNALQVIIPRTEVATTEVTYKVTKYVTETKTRTVIDSEGRKAEQSYQVQVPYSENVRMTKSINKIPLKQRLTIPADDLRAWRLDGQKISSTELLELAKRPTHFFVHRSPLPFQGIDPYFLQVLNPNTVVINIGFNMVKKYEDKPMIDPTAKPTPK